MLSRGGAGVGEVLGGEEGRVGRSGEEGEEICSGVALATTPHLPHPPLTRDPRDPGCTAGRVTKPLDAIPAMAAVSGSYNAKKRSSEDDHSPSSMSGRKTMWRLLSCFLSPRWDLELVVVVVVQSAPRSTSDRRDDFQIGVAGREAPIRQKPLKDHAALCLIWPRDEFVLFCANIHYKSRTDSYKFNVTDLSSA